MIAAKYSMLYSAAIMLFYTFSARYSRFFYLPDSSSLAIQAQASASARAL